MALKQNREKPGTRSGLQDGSEQQGQAEQRGQESPYADNVLTEVLKIGSTLQTVAADITSIKTKPPYSCSTTPTRTRRAWGAGLSPGCRGGIPPSVPFLSYSIQKVFSPTCFHPVLQSLNCMSLNMYELSKSNYCSTFHTKAILCALQTQNEESIRTKQKCNNYNRIY